MIDPNYFDHENDVRDLIAGVRHMRKIVSQPALSDVVNKEISLGSTLQTDTELASAICLLTTTGRHPVGTCAMGADGDPGAMLDSHLHVRGVDGLWVVDGFSLPDQVSGNVDARIDMMAEKAADMILGRPSLPPDHPGEAA